VINQQPVCFCPFTVHAPWMKTVQEDPSPALTDAAKNWLAMDGLWFQAVEGAMMQPLPWIGRFGSSLP
jgi:hypothetical protein